MELTKQPETELEYWVAIEELGGFVWRMNHDLGDGRIEDPTGKIDQAIASAREISERLVTELSRFGVIHPKDCPEVPLGQKPPPAPEGKIYHWDWYKKMKTESYQRAYDGIICSACPFSKGVEHMIALGGVIPCSVFHGMLYRLRAPHACGMIDGRFNFWTEAMLSKRIRHRKNGKAILAAFRAKRAELTPAPKTAG